MVDGKCRYRRERDVETGGRENDCRERKIVIEKENGNDGREKGR